MAQAVIDSSVFVKLVIEEEYSENAHAIRDAYISKDIDIIVPSLFQYEVLNAVRYSGSFSESEMEDLYESIDNYNFGVFNASKEFAKNMTKYSLRYKITIYDAAYVALAAMTNSKLYTADQKLIDATNLPFIRHIREFK